MSKINQKPTRWYYVLALILPVLACLGAVSLVYRYVPKLPGTLGALGIKNLIQVVVPGSQDIHFQEAGAYAVYYEYRSDYDGVNYTRGETPPSMRCQLKSKKTGEAVRLRSTTVEGNIYASKYPERAGVMFKQISINQPGVYTFSCQYPDGSVYPKSVMSVGPNLVWEFFNVAAKPVAAIVFGTFAFTAACAISILIVGIVFF
jgi:hypothetical protein